VAIREEVKPATGLARTLGRGTATLMTAAMIIGTGIFGAIGPAAAKAESGILLAMTIGGVVAVFTGISAAQLGINYPKEGGAFTWSRELNHETIGFIAGVAYLGKGIFSLSVISLAFAEYSRQLAPTLPIPLLAAGAVLAVLVLNLFHVGLTTKVLIALMLVNVSLLGLYIALAAPAVTVGHFSNPLGDNGVVGVLAGAALFFWTWDGFMRTAIMAGEVKNPRHTIPVAILGGITIAAIVFLAVGATTLGVLGPLSIGTDNIPLFRAATQAIGVWGGGLILVTAWTASLSELVGDMLAASRVTFTMGEAGELPGWLGKVHSGARVPRNAVLVLGLIVVALVSTFDLRSVLAVASVFTLVWYIITHFSALRLRKEQRLTTPLFTWLGLAGCVALFWSLPVWASIIGLTTLALFAGVRWLVFYCGRST
jgi:basic amino acid/polyamine antiporter, APA family